jgi:hypothetical protein
MISPVVAAVRIVKANARAAMPSRSRKFSMSRGFAIVQSGVMAHLVNGGFRGQQMLEVAFPRRTMISTKLPANANSSKARSRPLRH